MKTKFIAFLKYAFSDWFSRGILITSLLMLIGSVYWLLYNQDTESLKWILIILTPVWILFWAKQAQAYKQYKSIPQRYKHNLYD